MRAEARQAGSALLDVKDLDVGYGPKIVARSVSFSVDSGELVAVLGMNGSGKTTVIKTIAGLIPALGGTVSLGGEGLGRLSLRDRAGRMSYVPQMGGSAWPFSVREVVAASRYARLGPFGSFGAQDRGAVDAAIEALDLEKMAERPFTTLSGGEARRVLVARALAQESPLMLLDEPCAHLDPGRQIELMESLVGLAGKGMGLLVSLHDVNLARRHAGRIVLMKPDGTVIVGTPDEILIPEILEEAYNTEFFFGHHADYGRFVLPMATLNGKETQQ